MNEAITALAFYWALSVLAVYRLAFMLTNEAGPANILVGWRHFLGRRAAGKKTYNPWHVLAEVFNCPYCLGFWLSLLPALWLVGSGGLVPHPQILPVFVLLWLAVAGGQSVLQRL